MFFFFILLTFNKSSFICTALNHTQRCLQLLGTIRRKPTQPTGHWKNVLVEINQESVQQIGVCAGAQTLNKWRRGRKSSEGESLGPFPCRSDGERWSSFGFASPPTPTRSPVMRYVQLKPPQPLFARPRLRCSQRGHEIATVLARCPADALAFAPTLGCLHKTPSLGYRQRCPRGTPSYCQFEAAEWSGEGKQAHATSAWGAPPQLRKR